MFSSKQFKASWDDHRGSYVLEIRVPFQGSRKDLLVIGFLDTLWVVLEIRVRFRVLFVRVPYYIGAIVGSPVVPLLPFFVRVPKLKLNTRKEGTLIIKRLLGNLGIEGCRW